jgi:membrane associated rhomboid family serine protease
MRISPQSLPNWAVGTLSGILYGVLFALVTHYLMDLRWTGALVAGGIGAPFFGVAMGFLSRQMKRMMAPTVGGDELTRKQRQIAFRAAQRGPIPEDPAVRAAAAEYARRHLDQAERRWTRFVIAFGAFFLLVSCVVGLFDDDRPWWRALLPLCGAALFSYLLFQPRRLRRRIAALTAEQPETS